MVGAVGVIVYKSAYDHVVVGPTAEESNDRTRGRAIRLQQHLTPICVLVPAAVETSLRHVLSVSLNAHVCGCCQER